MANTLRNSGRGLRLVLLACAAALVMAAMMVAMAMPAFAAKPAHQGDCVFENGETHCTERQVVGTGEEFSEEPSVEVCEDGTMATVVTATYRPYTDYRITETTYAGKSQQVKNQTTREERVYGTPYTRVFSGCSRAPHAG